MTVSGFAEWFRRQPRAEQWAAHNRAVEWLTLESRRTKPSWEAYAVVWYSLGFLHGEGP